MKTTIVIYACLVLLGLIAASIQTETITSTSPLFMWTVNGQVRDDNVYRHFKNCNHEGQVPFLSIAGPKIVIVQNNMATEKFLQLSGAYDMNPSNVFPTLRSVLSSSPSEVYPYCETSQLQIFDQTNSQKLNSLSEISSIALNTDEFYLIDGGKNLMQLDDVVQAVHAEVSKLSAPVNVIVMAARSEVPIAVHTHMKMHETIITPVAATSGNDTFVNTLLTDGAVTGGTLVGFLLVFFGGLAIFTLLQLSTAPHITDDYKMKDVKNKL